MRPATRPPSHRSAVRLLAVDAERGVLGDGCAGDLPSLLDPGDVVVVNDAATLPASLAARTAEGAFLEIRLLGYRGGADWHAVLFGEGDWRAATEHRPAPPALDLGARLRFAGGLEADLAERSDVSDRLVVLRFDREPESMWSALYAAGVPVQYSYLEDDLDLWSVQTAYAARPWAVEMPSAGRPIDGRLLLALRERGIEVVALTHAAGLSSTGDPDLDAALPLPERYDIPAPTVEAIQRARRGGHRVVAIGTTVVRALEGSTRTHGELVAGTGITDLRLHPGYPRKIVDALLTGIHAPSESHYQLLGSFADEEVLREAWDYALGADYRCHEFGDIALLFGRPTPVV